LDGRIWPGLLQCSSYIEEKAAKAYEHITRFMDATLIEYLLTYVARDLLKHAEFFKMATRWVPCGAIAGMDGCKGIWGEVGGHRC